uniref:Centromere protein W n=1 Tax=Spermophilus dauricus TaxID=99837 RepID=A0A8C9QS07_SPEDA
MQIAESRRLHIHNFTSCPISNCCILLRFLRFRPPSPRGSRSSRRLPRLSPARLQTTEASPPSRVGGDLLVHLNCLLFVHRLAEESRANACENKCGVINKDHVLAAAKVILKKSRG